MLLQTEGFVLRSTRYGDHLQIVTLYTRAAGIQSFSVRRKLAGSNVNALISPLSQVNIVAEVRPHQKIHYPRELSLAYSYAGIHANPVKSGILLFFCELFSKVLKEEEANENMYGFLVTSLRELDRQNPLYPSYHLTVMLQLTSFLGFFPENSGWNPTSCFDLREGIFTSASVAHPDFLGCELSSEFNKLIGVSFDQYQSFMSSREERNHLLDALINFYSLHIAGFGEMKSLPVLRSLF